MGRKTNCNLFKCWRQEELLWVSADQKRLERSLSAIGKTQGVTASTRPALTPGPHFVTLVDLFQCLSPLGMIQSIYCPPLRYLLQLPLGCQLRKINNSICLFTHQILGA